MLIESLEDEEEFPVGLGLALDCFVEADEVTACIDSLPLLCSSADHGKKLEKLYQRLSTVLNYYQEQPHLLDMRIGEQIIKLLNYIRDGPVVLRHAAATVCFCFTKVRGYKIVIKHFPHEVSDLEPILSLLERDTKGEDFVWQTHFVILMWLSIIVLIPFQLNLLDSEKSMADRILGQCKRFIGSTDISQNAAAFLTSRFITRPDIVKEYLSEFFQWCVENIVNSKNTFQQIGCLRVIAAIYKQGKREDLLGSTPMLLKYILAANFLNSKNEFLLRRLFIKVIQRLGLIFLRVRVASWRYKRGARSLAMSFNAAAISEKLQPEREEEETYDDIPNEMEDIIESLINGLQDHITVIRWSAAKGIGRLTARLPHELADDIVSSILELFSVRETDMAWHGGCLALAELGRKGIILPKRLSSVVSVVLKALLFDERRGSFSVGSHIRDAACYVCWAFARAFDPSVLKPYVHDIAVGLIKVAVFDREVNCRRAASAAFQENVGRQKNFPHGIEILSITDYFAVGLRKNSFLCASVAVAKFSQYTEPLIRHLFEVQIGHWDLVVRQLSAKALYNLTPLDPEFMVKIVLENLLDNILCENPELFLQHGSIMALGEVLSALASVQNDVLYSSALLGRLKEVIISLVEKQRLKEDIVGGDLFRHAAASFIRNCSEAHLPIHDDLALIQIWQQVLDDNLGPSTDPVVQQETVAAISSLVKEYYTNRTSENELDISSALRDESDLLLKSYLSNLDENEDQRRNFCLAVGSLPRLTLEGKLDVVLKELIRCSKITASTLNWAEGRRDALKAICNIVETMDVASGNFGSSKLCEENIFQIYDCFLLALDDYTITQNGGVGAWVREVAIIGVEKLTLKVMSSGEEISLECLRNLMPALAQQAGETIDRTRGIAGKSFANLITYVNRNGRFIDAIPRRNEIAAWLPSNATSLSWGIESISFPLLVNLLDYPEYFDRFLLALVVSVGGITKRLVQNSTDALLNKLSTMSSESKRNFCGRLIGLFSSAPRILIPTFNFLDIMLNCGHFDFILDDCNDTFASDLFYVTKKTVTGSCSPAKLIGSCSVFCGLLQSSDSSVVRSCLVKISIYLCHKYPRVRKIAATKLYETLITFADKNIVPSECLDDVMEILSDTNWDQDISLLKSIRNDLCAKMNVSAPVPVKATQIKTIPVVSPEVER